jgi:hypothetical protein
MAQPKRVAAAAACACVFTIKINSSSWFVVAHKKRNEKG